uniref:Putative sulfotransferase 1 family member d1 n=1 Tax=Nyssomyia neivai TaxID=330878 RepID=A0A1L8E519_9DIPT
MTTYSETVPRDDAYEKAKYMGLEDFCRYGSRNNVDIAKKWAKKSYFLPTQYEKFRKAIEDFEVRPDDVWVVTFPKCGTTWTQEMVWQIGNNLDFAKGREIYLNARFPFIELGGIVPDEGFFDSIGIVANLPSPRYIKSHLPAPLLPKQLWSVKPKVIYVARNAKDTMVSFYHHYRNLQDYRRNFNDFTEIFMKDLVIYAPFDTHIIDFWHMRHEENILFLTFEDMKRNHPAVIEKTIKFLGKSFTKEQIAELADHLTFDKMSKNESVDLLLETKDMRAAMNIKKLDEDFTFVRKGKVGSFKDDMNPEMIQEFNDWLQKRLTDLNVEPELWKIFFLQDPSKK